MSEAAWTWIALAFAASNALCLFAGVRLERWKRADADDEAYRLALFSERAKAVADTEQRTADYMSGWQMRGVADARTRRLFAVGHLGPRDVPMDDRVPNVPQACRERGLI